MIFDVPQRINLYGVPSSVLVGPLRSPFSPEADSTVSYHRPTTLPHLSLGLQRVLPVVRRVIRRGRTA